MPILAAQATLQSRDHASLEYDAEHEVGRSKCDGGYKEEFDHRCLCGRGGRIRTYDFSRPRRATYQTGLHPVVSGYRFSTKTQDVARITARVMVFRLKAPWEVNFHAARNTELGTYVSGHALRDG